VLVTESLPQGYPPGRGLFVRKLGNVGADKIPRVELPLVLVCGRAAERVVTMFESFDKRPILYESRVL
jgi:hypothetical protein